MIVTDIKYAPDVYAAFEPLFACAALGDVGVGLRIVGKTQRFLAGGVEPHGLHSDF